MNASRWHGGLLLLGFVPAVILLGRLSWDLASLGWPMAIPMAIFFLGFVFLGVANGLAAFRGRHAERGPGKGARVALVLAIPVAFLGAITDCMGLEFRGCTSMCSFLMNGWAPLTTVLVLTYLGTGRAALLTATSAATLLFVVPNCVCYNPVNGPWIDLLGRSPACFAGAFGVTLVALGALRTGRHLPLAIGFAWLATAAMLAFFVGHHFYDYPW